MYGYSREAERPIPVLGLWHDTRAALSKPECGNSRDLLARSGTLWSGAPIGNGAQEPIAPPIWMVVTNPALHLKLLPFLRWASLVFYLVFANHRHIPEMLGSRRDSMAPAVAA